MRHDTMKYVAPRVHVIVRILCRKTLFVFTFFVKKIYVKAGPPPSGALKLGNHPARDEISESRFESVNKVA